MNAQFQPMVLQTSFAQAEQLLEVLVAQGEGSNLVLPHPSRIEDGELVHFSLLLEDGQVALEGVGACIASYPTDDDQYDVIVGSVQPVQGYEEMFGVLWSMRGLTARDFADAEGADVLDVEIGETESLSPTVEVESRAGKSSREDRHELPHDGSFLRRPRVAPAQRELVPGRSSYPAPTGLFTFSGDRLPQPSRPPRPSTSPTQRVRRSVHGGLRADEAADSGHVNSSHSSHSVHSLEENLQNREDRFISESEVDADEALDAMLEQELDAAGTSHRPR
jgi:hypothetical protein